MASASSAAAGAGAGAAGAGAGACTVGAGAGAGAGSLDEAHAVTPSKANTLRSLEIGLIGQYREGGECSVNMSLTSALGQPALVCFSPQGSYSHLPIGRSINVQKALFRETYNSTT